MTEDKLLAEMQALRDRITGITGTAVASRDGLIIREDTGGVNPDNLAALTSAALSLAQRLAREAGQGTLREAVTRSSGGYVAIYAIGTSAVLVLLGDEGLEQGEAQLQQSGEEAAFDRVDAEAVTGGLLGEGNQAVELLMGLEESVFLRHDHGRTPAGRSSGVVLRCFTPRSPSCHPQDVINPCRACEKKKREASHALVAFLE